MAFRLPIDIINRALVHLGKERIRTLTDHSVNAQEGNAAYDNLRLAELRRNPWTFAIRRVVLRAIDDDTVLFTPDDYASGTTYAHGAIVVYNNQWWESQVGSNTGNTPEPGTYWQNYFGTDAAVPYDSETTYFTGELVVGSDDAVYRSTINANDNDPVDVGTGWLSLGGSTAALTVLYPIGTGPATDSSSRYVYRLPKGYLRKAPTDPKAGTFPYLGGAVNLGPDDWTFEGGYIVTSEIGPVMMRYVADVSDVSTMDPMFCEALAARVANEICFRVLADASPQERAEKKADTRAHYRTEMAEARMVNGIEAGPVEAWEDEWITVRY
jgi:hypothetical protein